MQLNLKRSYCYYPKSGLFSNNATIRSVLFLLYGSIYSSAFNLAEHVQTRALT